MNSDSKRPLLLDTGPLMRWLCSRYLDSQDASEHRRNDLLMSLHHQWDAELQRQMDTFLETRTPWLTTSHVILESLHIRKQAKLKAYEPAYRTEALKYLSAAKEVPVKLAELNQAEQSNIAKYGLTDVALIHAGRTYGATIVTDDKRLFRALEGGDPNFEIQLAINCVGY